LGGLLVWRNVAWQITNGQTISLYDDTFLFFGGSNGTLGGFWSIVLGAVAIVAAALALFNARRRKIRHGFPVKPLWAEVTVAGTAAALLAGLSAILLSHGGPSRVVQRDFEAYGCIDADSCRVVYGLPASVLLLVAVAIVMTLIATRTR